MKKARCRPLCLPASSFWPRASATICQSPPFPSLLHGDLWTGNVLVRDGRVAGLVDPPICRGHREIELAFATLFGTFGSDFFDAYASTLPLAPGFHEERRDIYNLYPRLVHVRLFGSGYLAGIDATLRRCAL